MWPTEEFLKLSRIAGGGVLNEPGLIELVSRVYRCEPRHRLAGETGVPMFFAHKPLLEQKIISMPFNFYPRLVGKPDGEAALEAMMAEAESIGPSTRVVCKMEHNVSDEFMRSCGLRRIVNSIESRLELCRSIEDERKRRQKRLGEKIRKAARDLESLGFELRAFTDLETARSFYELMARQYRDKHRMLPQPWSLFEGLFSVKLEDGFVRGYAVFVRGEILSGILVLGDLKEWKYCWGATRSDCPLSNASALLIDHAIEQAIGAGACLFNLGSSSPTDEDLRSFKSHWGATEHPIHSYYWKCAPRSLDLRSDFSLLRGVIRRTPLTVLKRISAVAVPWLI